MNNNIRKPLPAKLCIPERKVVVGLSGLLLVVLPLVVEVR